MREYVCVFEKERERVRQTSAVEALIGLETSLREVMHASKESLVCF